MTVRKSKIVQSCSIHSGWAGNLGDGHVAGTGSRPTREHHTHSVTSRDVHASRRRWWLVKLRGLLSCQYMRHPGWPRGSNDWAILKRTDLPSNGNIVSVAKKLKYEDKMWSVMQIFGVRSANLNQFASLLPLICPLGGGYQTRFEFPGRSPNHLISLDLLCWRNPIWRYTADSEHSSVRNSCTGQILLKQLPGLFFAG